MRTFRRGFLCGLAFMVIGGAWSTIATDISYPNLRSISSNGRYTLEAKSPDNRRGSSRPFFQKSFVYTLTDVTKRSIVWKRKQQGNEGSCRSLFVENDGWVVIRTGWDELIIVNPAGRETGTPDILDGGLTKAEHKRYVQETTAGPEWSGYSHWYFLQIDEQRLFVIRPWWGRRLIVDLEAGRFVPETREISTRCLSAERDFVMKELKTAIQNRDKWEQDDCCGPARVVLVATYLAGKLGLAEAVPLIRNFEDSRYSVRGTPSFFASSDFTDGEIDPQGYSEFTLRQVVQLSLRRLREIPRPFPAYEFTKNYKDSEKNHRFTPPSLPYPRHTRTGAVRAGMKATEVLALIGCPDVIRSGTWEYDMDSTSPYTLVISWDQRQVKGITRKSPPVWRAGTSRDEYLVY